MTNINKFEKVFFTVVVSIILLTITSIVAFGNDNQITVLESTNTTVNNHINEVVTYITLNPSNGKALIYEHSNDVYKSPKSFDYIVKGSTIIIKTPTREILQLIDTDTYQSTKSKRVFTVKFKL